MIERFDGGSSEVKNMIDIQFQQASNQDKTSEIRILFIGQELRALVPGNIMTMQRPGQDIGTTVGNFLSPLQDADTNLNRLAPVVQRLDNFIRWIRCYSASKIYFRFKRCPRFSYSPKFSSG